MSNYFVLIIIAIGVVAFYYESAHQEKLRTIRDSQESVSLDILIEALDTGEAELGVYIIRNVSNGKHYVGQSKDVRRRLKDHINGRGNKDVYFDFRSGESFCASFVRHNSIKFLTLNEQERYYISLFDSYHKGYNRTRGNGPSI